MKDTNPKDAIGATKVPISLVPATALVYQAMAHLWGSIKYGVYNWRTAGVRTSIYVDAIHRHLAAYANGEDNDPESGLPHLAHLIAGANILLDAEECGKLADDRPPPAPVAELINDMNEIISGWPKSQAGPWAFPEEYGACIPPPKKLPAEKPKLERNERVYQEYHGGLPVVSRQFADTGAAKVPQ